MSDLFENHIVGFPHCWFSHEAAHKSENNLPQIRIYSLLSLNDFTCVGCSQSCPLSLDNQCVKSVFYTLKSFKNAKDFIKMFCLFVVVRFQ